jgi:hypothetical protein
MELSTISYLGTAISGLVAVIGLPIALVQLYGLKKTLNYSNLMSMLSIEFELNRRKERLANIMQQNSNNLIKTKINKNKKECIMLFNGFRREAYEDYLNIFDRLSYFILNGNLSEKDFRLDYREMLFETIENDNDEMFTVTSRYRNMLNLYNKWKNK